MAELQLLRPLTSSKDSATKHDRQKSDLRQKLEDTNKKWIIWLMLLILLAGWMTAIVFMVLWEICHERRILPDPFVSDTAMRKYYHAAVATDDEKCSEIAKNFMEQGGNAVDAAIAGLLCNGIQNAQSMGLGGGFFMVIYNSTTRSCTAIDAQETAPQQATKNFYAKNPKQRLYGPNSIGVPGELAGYWIAHQRFGSMPWKSLFEPSIRLAENGFVLRKGMLDAIRFVGAERSNHSSFDFLYDDSTRAIHEEGDFLRRPVYAQTLTALANAADPVDLFYRGNMASVAVNEIQQYGGIMTIADFANYQPRVTPGYMVTLKNGLQLCVPQPPSSGAALGFFFQLLEALNLPSDSTTKDVNSAVHYYHFVLEALKYTMAEWAKLADPGGYSEMDSVKSYNYLVVSQPPVPGRIKNFLKFFMFPKATSTSTGNDASDFSAVLQIIQNLTSPNYIDAVKSRISSRSKHDADHYTENVLESSEEGTAHLSFIDQHGNAVSVTSTINWAFGSGHRSEKLDIIWNNELANFDEPATDRDSDGPANPYNFIEPGHRPRSAMSPSIFLDNELGEVKLVTGGSGGTQIISAIVQVAARVLYFNETLKVATDAPRVHNALFPYVTKYDINLPGVIVKGLEDHWHQVDSGFSFPSAVQSIFRKNGILYAQSDYRKGGESTGF